MFITGLLSAAALASTVVASPVMSGYQPFPLADGFPAPSPSQLRKIQLTAGGALPEGGLPTDLTPTGEVVLRLIALNELFEVAFFNNLVTNIQKNAKGFQLKGAERDFALRSFTTIRAQEELHALGANAILANAGKPTQSSCRYILPAADYQGSVALINTVTDLVLSVLPVAQGAFAADGAQEVGLIPLVGSIIAQEGEQNGWYRVLQNKVASAAPFLTTSNPAFAFSALQQFIVPGSCDIKLLKDNIPTFKPLTVVSTPGPKDGCIKFSVAGTVSKGQSIVFLTGAKLPVTAPITKISTKKGVTTFETTIPFVSEIFSKGLTVAALVNGKGHFADAAAVAAVTVAGPGLIEIA